MTPTEENTTDFTFPQDLICPPDTYRWSSHSPERRAASETEGARETMVQVCACARRINAENHLVKITQADLDKTFAYFAKIMRAKWSASSRCASAMITGPANFPTERNRKRQEVEHKRMGEVVEFYENYEARLRRIANPRPVTASVPIEQATVTERDVNGVRVIEDEVIDRLQLVFDGKPDPETIAHLKSRGFKWSPKNGAWQRQLTNNARHAAKQILSTLEAA
jgi:hypothetical protein